MNDAVIEMRLPWIVSTAWHAVLTNAHVSEGGLLSAGQELGHQAMEILSPSLVETLRGFRDDPMQCALILRNCPLDKCLPPTPYRGVQSPTQTPVACLVNLALFQLLGISPVVYEGENEGRLFRHVVPVRNSELEKSSHGSRTRFGYHVDNPDLPLTEEPVTDVSACPEYLSLFGMRCDPGVKTTLVLVQPLLDRLGKEVIDVLASPRFMISRPASFCSARQTADLPLIVKAANGQWLCRFDTENTCCADATGARAIALLREVLDTREFDLGLLLLPGDFLIFKNQLVLHARDAFTARHDGVDRWLMRLFGVADMARTVPARTGRAYEIAA